MIFEPQRIALKDGRCALLRSPEQTDAAALLDYLRATFGETEFLLRYPEECTLSPEQEAAFLQSVVDSPSELMLLCEIDGEVAGNCHISFMDRRIKTAHRASVGIAVRQKYWRLGIGSAMFRAMIATAMERPGTELLELEVIEGNDRAMALYKKFGFEVVGARPYAIRLKDGRYLDEYIMVKRL